jgi:hypothetical protein
LAPQVKIDQLLSKLIEGAIQKQLTDRLLGAGRSERTKNDDPANPEKLAPEAEKPPETIEDAVGDLLKGLGKKKKK